MSASRKREAPIGCTIQSAPPTKKQKVETVSNEYKKQNGSAHFDEIFMLLMPQICEIFIAFNDEKTTNSFERWAECNSFERWTECKDVVYKHKFQLLHPALVHSNEYKILMDHIFVLHQQNSMSYIQLYNISVDPPHLNINYDVNKYKELNLCWENKNNHVYISEKVPKLGHILLFTNIIRRAFDESTENAYHVVDSLGSFGSYTDQPEIFAFGIHYLIKYYSRYIPDILKLHIQNNLFLKSFAYYNDTNGVKKLRSLDVPIKGINPTGTGFLCADMWTEVMDQTQYHDIELIKRIGVSYNHGKIRINDLISADEINELHNAFTNIEKEQKNEYDKQMSSLLNILLKKNALQHEAIDVAKQLLLSMQ